MTSSRRTLLCLALALLAVLAVAPALLARLEEVGWAARRFPGASRFTAGVAFVGGVGAAWLAGQRRLSRIEERVRERTRLVRAQNEALVELARRAGARGEDLQDSLREITETAARVMAVARTSVWVIDDERTRMWCVDEFDATAGRHTCGAELARADYPRYFRALEEDRAICGGDAYADERMAEFVPRYLPAFGIRAMLDAPVRVRGRAVGVVCHEHVGGPRAWTAEEEHFADCLANLVATTMESWERQRAEAALRVSEERNRLVARATNDVVWDWVLGGKTLYWSDALLTVFGHDPGNIEASMDWWESHVHPDDRERVVSGINTATATGAEHWTAEYRFRRADGTYATVLDRGWVARDPDGRAVRMIGSMLDLSDRLRGEELERERAALKRAVASMDHVLGVVGHELRTPLAGLRAMSEFLLTDGARGAAEFDTFLRGIHDEVVRMSGTVHNLLEAARLNSGKARWNWAEFAVADVCVEAVESLRPVVDPARVALTLVVEPPGLTMRGDADAVRRLVMNLLSNAHKHTAAGSIAVTAGSATMGPDGVPAVCVEVRDTGCGIAPDVRARLGEAFALNSGVVGKAYVTGTGLGVAICKGIVLAHGGEMDIESAPGRGTLVRATLRADLPEPEPAAGRPGGAEREAVTEGMAA
jgi:PAS domain S-box-containing protein